MRLIPFLFHLHVIACRDRVTFAYAALGMNSDLGISMELFGFFSGIFFISYLIFEVPSNIILQRAGARVWIARNMVSWCIVAIALINTRGKIWGFIGPMITGHLAAETRTLAEGLIAAGGCLILCGMLAAVIRKKPDQTPERKNKA